MRRVGLIRCPYCGDSDVKRSRINNLWEKLSALFLLRLSRCHSCWRRHYRPMFLPVAKAPERRNPRPIPTPSISDPPGLPGR